MRKQGPERSYNLLGSHTSRPKAMIFPSHPDASMHVSFGENTVPIISTCLEFLSRLWSALHSGLKLALGTRPYYLEFLLSL